MFNESNIYFSLWSKYRPVILQLMKASANEAQQYKLSAHEFKAIGDKNKSGYVFALETQDGKASNNIAGSAPAKDLLMVLQQSKTGALLLSEASYQLKLDKQFVFHVTRKTEVMPVGTSEVASEG